MRLPLYPGTANGKTVWYVLLDASDAGLAHDLGVNYAPKLANIAVSDPAAVQTVRLRPIARTSSQPSKNAATSAGARGHRRGRRVIHGGHVLRDCRAKVRRGVRQGRIAAAEAAMLMATSSFLDRLRGMAIVTAQSASSSRKPSSRRAAFPVIAATVPEETGTPGLPAQRSAAAPAPVPPAPAPAPRAAIPSARPAPHTVAVLTQRVHTGHYEPRSPSARIWHHRRAAAPATTLDSSPQTGSSPTGPTARFPPIPCYRTSPTGTSPRRQPG